MKTRTREILMISALIVMFTIAFTPGVTNAILETIGFEATVSIPILILVGMLITFLFPEKKEIQMSKTIKTCPCCKSDLSETEADDAYYCGTCRRAFVIKECFGIRG